MRIRGRLLRLFRAYEAIFAIWNMDAGIGRSNDQRICIGLEPSWEMYFTVPRHI